MHRFLQKLQALRRRYESILEILLPVISGAALLSSIIHLPFLPFDAAWIAVVLCGIPILTEAIRGLLHGFDITAGVLVSIALIASVCIGESFAAGEIAFIMQLGELLEELTVNKARGGIEKLIKMKPQTARLLQEGRESIIPARQVVCGDLLRILPGETVPVDGVIIKGQPTIDQSVLTGESMPVDKAEGDTVYSGSVNRFCPFDMEATRTGEDSALQKMIRLVQSADAGNAGTVRLVDRWATVIICAALAGALLGWLISGELIRGVTVLIVFCPCALVLSTPTAIVAAIGNAASHGILIREGDALERLATITGICFDKTGTLTRGTPQVTAVCALNGAYSETELFRLAACAEKLSEHPLGKAVVSSYLQTQQDPAAAPDSFTAIPGKGVCAETEGKRLLVGNLRLMQENNISPEPFSQAIKKLSEQGCAVMALAVDGKAAGVIALRDTLRDGAEQLIAELRNSGTVPVLLTGDNTPAADAVARRLQITRVVADCLPEDKLNYIARAQMAGEKLCMVGDGINDAPALKKAYVGIAMAGIGSDIAIEAADIALTDDSPAKLPYLLALSQRMMRTIRLNLIFSLLLNFTAVALALSGVFGPVLGALIHNAGALAIMTNSALLLWRREMHSRSR